MPFQTDKVTLCWPNEIDRCTLTSSNTFTLPLNNAKTRVLKERARSSDTEIEIEAALDSARPIGAVSLMAHNLSVTANWRITLLDALDAELESSGWLPVWPSVFQSFELNWEDDNFWLGTPGQGDRERFTPLATWFADRAWLVSTVVIEIDDTEQPEDWIEFGRIGLFDVFQPAININYGVQFDYVDPTEIDQALDTTEFFDEIPQRRTATMAFDSLDEGEAFARIYRMRRDLGISRELLFAYRINSDSTYIQRTMLCRFAQPSALSHPSLARYAHGLELLEII